MKIWSGWRIAPKLRTRNRFFILLFLVTSFGHVCILSFILIFMFLFNVFNVNYCF